MCQSNLLEYMIVFVFVFFRFLLFFFSSFLLSFFPFPFFDVMWDGMMYPTAQVLPIFHSFTHSFAFSYHVLLFYILFLNREKRKVKN